MFSIITPLDPGRLEQFKVTKLAYDKLKGKREFIIPTRNREIVAEYLRENKLLTNVKLIPYELESGFNVSRALNLGVRSAKYETVVITSPEVKPITPVLEQLADFKGKNVICQVFDESESGDMSMSLVNHGFRSDSPAMYFLAMFNKSDIEKINGWDEAFLEGYAYEDDDFGARWNRAGLPFIIREDIQGIHQYHPRTETIPGGSITNYDLYQKNNANSIVWAEKGLT